MQSVPPQGAEHTTKRGSNLSVSLQKTHPTQERLATPPGSTSPTLFELWCGFFYVPQEPEEWKFWNRTYGFSSLSVNSRIWD